MKVLLLQVDKTQDDYISEGFNRYAARLAGYVRFECITISMPKQVRQMPEARQKDEEASKISEKIPQGSCLVLLDEKGSQFTSREFAAFIGARQNASVRTIVFVIGGPFGFSDALYGKADFKISLSRMTFSHQMVRLFFAEQLYRAFSILKGEKYHHD